MISRSGSRLFPTLGVVFGATLLGLLVLPFVALSLSTSGADLVAGLRHPLFAPALWLSFRTTALTLALVVILGTPLSWWLAFSSSRGAKVAQVLVELPIVIPPAVVGIALLKTFGRSGLLGPPLATLDVVLPFTEQAVVLAQLVVSAPFFIQAGVFAFRKVDWDMLTVARTLGASPAAAFFRIAVPIASPGLVAGAALCWARSLGEFGATLIFAGNLQGRTQTLPLAIYTALESDLRLAIVLSLVLAGVGAVFLAAIRLVRAQPRGGEG